MTEPGWVWPPAIRFSSVGQVDEDAPALEDLHDALLHNIVGLKQVDPLAVEVDGAARDRAALGFQQARNCLERGGLAGSVGAEHSGNLALRHLDRAAFQHQDHIVVNDLDIIEIQHRFMPGPFG